MKTRQIFSLFLVISLLLYGCGTDYEKTDVSQTEVQMESSAEESIEENIQNKRETELTAEDVKRETEPATEDVKSGQEAESEIETETDKEDTPAESAAEQTEVLKQNLLTAAGAKESDILLLDCDDFDGDGKYEAFMMCGSAYDANGTEKYKGRLYFAGSDGNTFELDSVHDEFYRMIDGKMKFGSGRKYLFFYSDYCLTANISEIWTVEDGKPVEISGSLQSGQVVYHGGDDFEIWIDAYDHFCDKNYNGEGDDLWTGHTWKPYFYHYNDSSDQLEAYTGEEISKEAFKELSGTNIIEEIEGRSLRLYKGYLSSGTNIIEEIEAIEAEEYTVGEIIRWENDIITINYHSVRFTGGDNPSEHYIYEHVIWDNRVKDFWQKKTGVQIDSWEDAGVGGSYSILSPAY